MASANAIGSEGLPPEAPAGPEPAASFLARLGRKLTAEQEDKFFGSLKTSNATWKLTSARRFEALDHMLLNSLRVPAGSAVSVLDVGASSGVTTLELHRLLGFRGYHPDTTATDRVIRAFAVPIIPGCYVIADGEGEILQYVAFGRLIRPWSSRTDRLIGAALLRRLLHMAFHRKVRRTLKDDPERCEPVGLVSRQFASQPGLRLVEDDVLVRRPEFEQRFDVVRAANILNRGYFGESDLRQAIRNLVAYMHPQTGLLLLVRTQRDGNHDGTLFAKAPDGRLSAVRRIGRGSEVEAFALDVAQGDAILREAG